MTKLPQTGTSIFSKMTSLANQYDAINLSQGFPNFPIDKRLVEILSQTATEDIHQYMPSAGYPPLLEKIASLLLQSYQRKITPEKEILITAGATQGIYVTLQALIAFNDEVIILDPSYDSYEPAVLLANGKPIRIPLDENFCPNWNLIAKNCSDKTKMIIINNPHNPSGNILNEADFIALEFLISKFPNLIVLSDEVYEYITFEEKHLSAHTRKSLRNHCITVSSFGKTFHITGWKIGYLVAPEHLMKEIKKVHQFLVFSVNSIAQVAINHYLDEVELPGLGAFYQEKRDYFRKLLHPTPFELLPCKGTYFQVASYHSISNENDVQFCENLVKNQGVAAIPLSPFYKNNTDLKMIRFCFAKDNETLEKAAQKLLSL
ncbi:methionine aminotransferase [Flavobacterium agrisoli]|uniref:Aminotransferase class I/II-fold pyridoxal phosphate-dependent enzyme n=1 Tax=Flavobacterium agrisoli TaxID=2793066 RepID=A0A934PND0_9FLAO|nr:methionine aminotransferase [Flavobacterium agrisoli]MBK0369979.1 aminotransferase class I/II-fold pyridoxal phosphate-dependent enzyme [Flavobacterium agrisoli]